MKRLQLFALPALLLAPVLTGARTAQAADPVLTDYTWSAGAQPTHMQPAATSFCVLHEVIGSFLSANDTVSAGGIANDGTWELYGSGGITGAKAECVNSNAAEVQNGVTEYWLATPGASGDAQRIINADYCFAMAVAGYIGPTNGIFSAADIRLYPNDQGSGQWLQFVTAEGGGQVISEVGCVNMTGGVPAITTGQFTSNGDANNGTPPAWPSNLCSMDSIQGQWSTSQSFGQIVVNPSRGTQRLQTSGSGFGAAGEAAMCLLLDPIQ